MGIDYEKVERDIRGGGKLARDLFMELADANFISDKARGVKDVVENIFPMLPESDKVHLLTTLLCVYCVSLNEEEEGPEMNGA